MKLTFLGATHEVTGSCTLIEACGKKILVDSGMEQGRNYFENEPVPKPEADIDFILLTHAHIDHSGLVPLRYKNGFEGEIHATKPTCNLCNIMLRDSAHIQEFEAEWRNRKAKRSGKPEFIPLYTMEHAEGALSLFVPHNYNERDNLCEGIDIRFTDVGHLLGSSAIEIWINEDGEERKIVFSGDLGNIDQPLLRDPQKVESADYVVIESTYGDRVHEKPADYETELAKILNRTFDRGGSVIIPSFAVGRTQELLYFIRHIKNEKMVKANFTVYVDSPLAIEATNIFTQNEKFCYDEEAIALVSEGINPISFDGLKTAISADDSKAINFDDSCKVIISASGMCEAGRIRHHLKHNIWNPANTVLFVGYQAEGTLGRRLFEGADKIKLFSEEVQVKAEITTLPGISGHADMNGLQEWLKAFAPAPKKVFVNHGESAVCDSFAQLLRDEYALDVYAPYSGAEFDMITNEVIVDAEPTVITKSEKAETPESKRVTEVYRELMNASQRLQNSVNRSNGRANKDIKKLTEKINKLIDEWEK